MGTSPTLSLQSDCPPQRDRAEPAETEEDAYSSDEQKNRCSCVKLIVRSVTLLVLVRGAAVLYKQRDREVSRDCADTRTMDCGLRGHYGVWLVMSFLSRYMLPTSSGMECSDIRATTGKLSYAPLR